MAMHILGGNSRPPRGNPCAGVGSRDYQRAGTGSIGKPITASSGPERLDEAQELVLVYRFGHRGGRAQVRGVGQVFAPPHSATSGDGDDRQTGHRSR